MTSFGRRSGIIFLAVAVIVPLLLKSRSVPHGDQAAFLRYTTGSILVKVAGSGDRDGIYRFSDGVTLECVKNMTIRDGGAISACQGQGERRLENGDMVVFNSSNSSFSEIAVKKMTATEYMLLGIPLDPDSLSAEEWEALPGIGPALARTIVEDRQKNGEFGSLDGVLRVPGIGYGTIKALRKFF